MGSIHNELRRAGAIGNGLKLALGADDSEGALERFGETMQPIINLWDRNQPEWALLRRERLWAVVPSNTPTAAEFCSVGIRNPTGSGKIVVVEACEPYTSPDGSQQIEVRTRAQGASDATGAVSSRDTRLPNQTLLSTLGLADSNAARQGSNLFSFWVPAGTTPRYKPLNVVLAPGWELWVGAAIVNIGIWCNFWGRERTAFSAELEARL